MEKNVINDLVGYDNLKIVQNNEYFNFSLESILIPRFCILKKKMKIIDFCTGNAPIPLVLSTLTDSEIIGVEIQKEIYALATESVKINGLEERISILNEDVKKLPDLFETDTFDLITCNPPYFKVNESSNLNDNYIKTVARHEVMLTLNDIFAVSRKLLKNNGSVVMVHRTDRLSEILTLMTNNNLQPKRIRFIYPKEGKESNLVLIDAKKNGKIGVKVLPPLYCHNDDGSYTSEVLKMFERM
ncbi:MAG: tRNA1(Val) (adenine(37)-N6)-methyltransferase [Tenericutes bacterium]|nr:tRNA1(Val) (adenine(37)-N6)-methyltransferase [Mycoplasmatota bacterium]